MASLKSMFGPRTIGAVGVGVIDIATRTLDSKGLVPISIFSSKTDLTRTIVTVGSLVANMATKGKTQELTEGVFLGALPLFEKTVYSMAKVKLFKGGALPLFATASARAAHASTSSASAGAYSVAPNGGIGVAKQGIRIGGGTYY